jgi:8-amino-7-oxononanoate synthase
VDSSDRKRSRAAFIEAFNPLLAQIEGLREAGSYPFYASPQFMRAEPGTAGADAPVILLANDYLGLSADPRVRAAACEAIERLGTSRCASPLAGGYTDLHRELEARLAAFFGQEGAVLFASGYQANVGIVSSLVRKGDLVLTDLYNHASIADGARLSGAEVRFFQHNSASHLERLLENEATGRRVLVIVEGIYSADGDLVRLPELTAVAHAHGALVMIDEAHSLGVLGEGGRGAAEHYGLLGEVDLVMGTMSKSLASVGGFVVADQQLVDVIAHNARSLIFSAALPPASAAAALAALEILASEPELRERLWQNARYFLAGLRSRGFDTMESETPVIPILIGDLQRTIELTARLREKGVLVCPAIPPMVQAHLSRVRAHVTARHDQAMLDRALETIDSVATAIGIPRSLHGRSARRARLRAAAKPVEEASRRSG